FASELKALLEDAAVERDVDLEALDRYASLLYVPSPASIFRDVRKLPAGHTLVCTPEGASIHRHRVEALEHRIRRVLGPRAGRAVARAAARLPVGTKGRNVLLDVGLPAEDGCARKF